MKVLGPGDGQVKEVRILNRTLRWTAVGIEYEPDQRHADRIVEELGQRKSKAVQTPCAPAGGGDEGEARGRCRDGDQGGYSVPGDSGTHLFISVHDVALKSVGHGV